MSFDLSSYQPRYLPESEIPVEGPDSYDVEDKRRALFQAESRLDTDLNGGEQIPDGELHPMHRYAVLNLATYHLVRSAKAPEDTTLGDISDSGDQRDEYAEQFREAYQSAIESLSQTDVRDDDAGDSGRYYGASGSGDGGYSVTANTRDDDGIETEYPYGEDDRFPD